VSCALSNDFLNSSNENGRLYSSKFFDLKFNLVLAKARRTLKQNRRTSWRNFVSKLNYHTPMNKVWNMVQKIKGKNNRDHHGLSMRNLDEEMDQ
jgi:hypothetical protein